MSSVESKITAPNRVWSCLVTSCVIPYFQMIYLSSLQLVLSASAVALKSLIIVQIIFSGDLILSCFEVGICWRVCALL